MRASSRLRPLDLAYIALFAILIVLCAWLTVPFAVPFTMQTFGVFTALLVLGGRRGFYAILTYLCMGLTGLPVFSGFQGGAGVLLGATGGYIAGFLASALLYWLITNTLGTSLPISITACLLGLLACYGAGTAWFMAVYAHTSGPVGAAVALSWCVIPFLLPDLAKLALAVLVSRRLKQHLK